MQPFRFVSVLALAAALPLLATSAQAADCDAKVRATARSDQFTDEAIIKVWAVDIDTQQSCVKVYVDAVLTERLFNGEEITTTRRGYRKASDQTTTYKVTYRIAKDSTLTDWSFKVASCVPCGTD